MVDFSIINSLVTFINNNAKLNDKTTLSQKIRAEFNLIQDRKVFYCENFAIRFCKASSPNFANTVLSLSALQKYDKIPFIVCVVLPQKNTLFLSNTTFLKRISHSSQELRLDNIRGSFNGSDIIKKIEDLDNSPENFEKLFAIHSCYTFEENLARLVESTNQISPIGKKFVPNGEERTNLFNSIQRCKSFVNSPYFTLLNQELFNRVQAVKNEICITAFIENVNIRGNLIESLITNDDSNYKNTLITALLNGTTLPDIKNHNDLGDYNQNFNVFETKTDIKTKILFLNSNPKAYNIDKLLKFLSKKNSVYLLYFIGIDKNKNIKTLLCPVFCKDLLNNTLIVHHWAGRNSKGVTQFIGKEIDELLENPNIEIDKETADIFIQKLLDL